MPVIDNETRPLLGELQKFLPHAERASIAVGYFFISGFAEIMDSLKRIEASDNPDHVLRLLISPTTDRRTAEAILNANESYQDAKIESERDVPKTKSMETARKEVTNTLEYMAQTDKEYMAVQKLIRLIRSKKMEVRVYTQAQLHAKAYIFELDEGQLIDKVAIVGSSNLSIAGIKEHAELNLQTEHAADHAELLEWFNRHWKDPSCQEFTEETAEILEKSWAGRDHTPNDVYGKASLHEHGEIELPDPEGPTGPKAEIELFDFQKKAVSEAVRTLDEYGGVIIADVVGMGKTYVGCSIMKHLREHQHAKPLVICPPHLKEMWEEYMRQFEIYGEVESRYKIGMDDGVLRGHTHCDVILVDESHHFRHHYTNAYRALSAFMDDKTDEARVILLTATPISNTIKDLKNQIKLFPAEGLERIPVAGAADLDEYFKGLENPDRTVSEEGTAKIQELLRHVLIRRVRGQIIERYAKADDDGRHYLEHPDGPKYFPKRRLQNPSEYDVDKVYNNAFESIEKAIGELRMARYVPGKYIREEFMDQEKYQDLASISAPLASIAKSTLLKRMESSIKAFDTSVKNYQRGYRLFKAQLDKGVVPIGREFKDTIYRMTGGDYDETDYEKDIAGITPQYAIGAFKVDEWKDDIEWDLRKLAEIMGHLQGDEYTKRDDKLHKLRDLIQEYDEKVLVFSESAETARYVYEYLKSEIPSRKMEQIDSKKGQREKMAAVRRFDPNHNPGIDIPSDRELSVLISTDVLSEGVNLHAARVVINYDFHWNPVRLIQRVGRIDRIGSEHPEIEIFNFLPTAKIEAKLELRDRVANKIQTIRKIIGADQRILEATEDIDEQGVTDIYDPQDGDSILDPKLRGGVLDIPETEAEKYAARIRLDGDKKKYFEGLPFGIRSMAGTGRLLIACEAEDILSRKGKRSSGEEAVSPLRRHYEVTKDGIKSISASSFLEQVGDDTSRITNKGNNSLYNEFVAMAWKKFNRDIKNERAKSPKRKHQEYFERKLTDIASHDSKLSERAKRLRPFATARMRPTHQPYRSLVDLHKLIDRGDVRDAIGIVSSLEKIESRYGDIEYERVIRKPRILYSLMVRI